MKIVFTNHAEKKLKDLEELGVNITKSFIKNVLENPLHVDNKSDPPNKIASGIFSEKHALRVVFREEGDIIIVITFYPAKKGRYFSYEV